MGAVKVATLQGLDIQSFLHSIARRTWKMFLKLVILIIISLNSISSEDVVEQTEEEMTTGAAVMEEHTDIPIEEEETKETVKEDVEPVTEKMETKKKPMDEIANTTTSNSTQVIKEYMEPCTKSEASSLRNNVLLVSLFFVKF